MSNSIGRSVIGVLTALALLGGIVGCEPEGGAERVGERIDEAAEKAGEGMKKAAEKAGDKIERATD